MAFSMQAVHTPKYVTLTKHAGGALCLPEASNAQSLGLNQVALCAVLLQMSRSPPLLPISLPFNTRLFQHQLFLSASFSCNDCIEKETASQFTVQDSALIFFLLYNTSSPAASEPLSAVVFCSLNATGLGLPGCIVVFTAHL